MSIARISVALVLFLGLSQAAFGADENKKKDTVDFRKLKELMPEKLGGLKRTECTGEKTKVADFTLSIARATYANEDGKDNSPDIDVEIADYAGTVGMAEGLTAWSLMEVDKETDDGYERTVKVSGYSGYETWNKKDKAGTLLVFVANRFLVKLEAKNLAADQTKKLGEALPLAKLAALDK